jgi:hypothetical protein
MFFSVALSGLKSLEIYDPGVPLTLPPRLYTVALSGLSSQASICFFESTILSSIFRMRRPCPLALSPNLLDNRKFDQEMYITMLLKNISFFAAT